MLIQVRGERYGSLVIAIDEFDDIEEIKTSSAREGKNLAPPGIQILFTGRIFRVSSVDDVIAQLEREGGVSRAHQLQCVFW